MQVHLAEQTMSFLYACLLGAVLGALYDAFRILRIAFKTSAKIIFLQDILYWSLCAVVSFLFLLTTSDGVVRSFLFIGELLGGVIYHFSAGQLIMKAAEKIIGAMEAFFRFLYRFFLYPLWRLFYRIVSAFLAPIRSLGHIFKKFYRIVKFRLKVRRIVLYNHSKGFSRIPGLKMKNVGAMRKKKNGAKTGD